MTERNDCIIVVPESGAIGIGVQEYGRGLVCNSNAGIFSFQVCKTVAFFFKLHPVTLYEKEQYFITSNSDKKG